MKCLEKYILLLSSLVIFTGCVSDLNSGNSLSPGESGQGSRFSTNQYSFLTSQLDATSSKNDRNSFLEEFITQSDMQCQHYLLNSQNRTEKVTNSVEQTLYMSIFDTVSLLFGVKYITDTAKEVFISNTNTNTPENQSMYQNALGPEIKRGVEIARLRYANAMRARKNENLESYSITNLQNDMAKYDKQCSNEFGLIEINKALRQAQNQMMRSGVAKPKIDPVSIKKKVEDATKKVEEETKKKEVKKKEAVINEKIKQIEKNKIYKVDK
ncbi:MAG TPA: hypothetical protein EYM49_06215 [Campylobacterales bacterium]|nr:hypothetical protein [Campylobacterales bacterium]